MKKVALLCMGLAFGAANAAEAQLTMQMSNGWSFTFAGNVNAFAVYDDVSDGGIAATPGGIVAAGDPLGGKGAFGIRTGLLPAFAVFDAKGKEGETDLGVHFGFAPQIQCSYTGGQNPSANGQGHDCFGAQIDMRQVFLTVGGTWGQILAGRELGLFGRQDILNDQTLFGVGATGGPDGRRHHPRPHRLRLHLPAVQGADDVLDARGPAVAVLDRSVPAAPPTRPT